MIRVTYIPCLLEDRRIEFKSHNLKIASILDEVIRTYPEIRQDSPYITIRLNGKKVSPFRWRDTVLCEGDRVTVIQDPGGEAIAAIGAAIGLWGAGATAGGLLGISAATAATVINIATLVATVAYSIYSAVTGPNTSTRKPNVPDNSPTYGWDNITMQCKIGCPVPVVLGEHFVAGFLIRSGGGS